MSSFTIEQLEAEQITQAMKDGAYMRTLDILNAIDSELATLPPGDVPSQIWWRRFKHLVLSYELDRIQKEPTEVPYL